MTEDQILLKLALDATSANQSTAQVVELQKKAAAQFVETWSSAAKKRADTELSIERDKQQKLTLMEKAGHDARVAAYQAAEERRVRIGQKNYQNTLNQRQQNAANLQAQISGGSGGYGSGFTPSAGNQPSMAGNHAINGLAGGADLTGSEKLGKAASLLSSLIGLAAMVKYVFGGDLMKEITHALHWMHRYGEKLLPQARALAQNLAKAAGWVGVVVESAALSYYSIKAGRAADESNVSTANLRTQSGTLAEKLGLPAGSSHEQIITKQHELMAAQNQAAKDAEAAQIRSIELAQEQERIATGKLKLQEKFNRLRAEELQLSRDARENLTRQRGIAHAGQMVDQESVTIGDLAGRRYTESLNKNYGAGGRFDIGAGDGPYARIAQDYLLAQKQQQWDIAHGRAVFNSKGELTGGDAYADKQRQIYAHNMLAGAGLDTPTMQFSEMRTSLKIMQADMASLALRAATSGLKISGTE